MADRAREAEIEEILKSFSTSEVAQLLVELLKLRRSRYRDYLESAENQDVRGKSQECKSLIHIFD